MANPTISDVHVSAALTDLSVAFVQDDDAFVADRVFGTVPVMKQADQFFVHSREDWLRSDAQQRAPGTESAGGGWRLTTSTYFCNPVALHQDVSDPERANADPAVNLDADATEYVTQQIKLKEEKDFQTNFFTTGLWDGASSSTDMTGQSAPTSTTSNFRQWNDVASTPIEDIRGEYVNIAKLTARRPQTFVQGANVWQHLSDHPDILDRIKHSEKGVVTADLVASLLGLDEVLTMWAVQNTAAEGSSAGTYAFIGAKAALLCYAEKNPGLRKPSAGYTFVWTGNVGTPREGARIKRFRMENLASDRIEGERWYDQKIVSSNLGAFFTSATA